MPYIKQAIRIDIDKLLDNLNVLLIEDAGQLNYVLTRVCQSYLVDGKPGYSGYNDVIGALECAKLELYRRAVAPYEDVKAIENGDVYE